MSGWSSVGLADRNAIEKLTELIEQLRAENGRSFEENTEELIRLISQRSNDLKTSQDNTVITLTKRVDDMQEYLSARMDAMAKMICGLMAENERNMESELAGTRTAIATRISSSFDMLKNEQAENQDKTESAIAVGVSVLKTDISGIDSKATRIESFIRQTDANHSNAHSDIQKKLNDMGEHASAQNRELELQLTNALQQIVSNQKCLADSSTKALACSNKELVQHMEAYCSSSLEQIKNTAEEYRKMANDEKKHLDEIGQLSGEMLKLGEEQRKVMARLAQLCQDSDQFMEIQKSINDIWEIMKVVWVHSLLDDFNRELKS